MTHLTKIGEHLLAGVIFHAEMTDLFHFLGLKGFYKWQKCQMCEEAEHLQNFKCHVLKYHHMLINLQNAQQPEKLIPNEWYSRSALEVSQTDVTNTLKMALDKYFKWEEETKKMLYAELAELEQISDKEEVEELIEDVECELAMVEALRQKIQITSFSPIFIQTLQKEFCEMYK